MKIVIGTGLALAILASPAMAQDNEVAPGARPANEVTPPVHVGNDAFGDCIWGPFSADLCSGENGNLGVVTGSNGYHVSTRGLIAPSHMVFVHDDNGICLIGSEYAQIAGSSSSSWGYRDGAASPTNLYFGWEGGLAEHNLDGSGGISKFAGAAPGGVGTWRALAYDPADGGSLWVCNFGSNLIRVAISAPGVVIDNFPNLDGWSLYGMTLDPQTGNLWGHSWNGDMIEIDTTTGRTTGVFYNLAGCATLFAAQGGLSGVPGGIGGSGNSWDIVGLQQGTPDDIFGAEGYPGAGMRLAQTGGRCGSTPVELTVTGCSGGPVALTYGFRDGFTQAPMCPPGVGVDIAAAKVAQIKRCSGGSVVFSGNVPAAACPRIRVQAFEPGTCTPSDKLTGLM